MKHIVLQFTVRDCIKGRTEEIKRKMAQFYETVYSKGITLTLSGPVPYPSLSNEAFSRAYAINQWLFDFCTDNEILLVNNFSFISCPDNLFMNKGRELNQRGSDMIGGALCDALTAICHISS